MTTRKDPIVKARIFGILWLVFTLVVATFSVLTAAQGGLVATAVGSFLRAFLQYTPYILFLIYIFLPASKRRYGDLLGIFCIAMVLLTIVNIVQGIGVILNYMRAQIESFALFFQFAGVLSNIINIVTFIILSIDCFTNFRLSVVSIILVIVKLVKTCLGVFVSFIFTTLGFANLPFFPSSSAASLISLAEKAIGILFVVSLLFVFKSAKQNRNIPAPPAPMV